MRLDHLLSKEHTPDRGRSCPGMVVFIDVETDQARLPLVELCSQGWWGRQTRCWGSEESSASLGLQHHPAPAGPSGWRVCGGVGLLFEIWIVDASILQLSHVYSCVCGRVSVDVWVGCGGCLFVCMCMCEYLNVW